MSKFWKGALAGLAVLLGLAIGAGGGCVAGLALGDVTRRTPGGNSLDRAVILGLGLSIAGALAGLTVGILLAVWLLRERPADTRDPLDG